MNSTPNQYEYFYQNNQPGHHHAYIINPLMEMISEMLCSKQKIIQTSSLNLQVDYPIFGNPCYVLVP
jgi:hypothetical protein